jgi:hypothetical protein
MLNKHIQRINLGSPTNSELYGAYRHNLPSSADSLMDCNYSGALDVRFDDDEMIAESCFCFNAGPRTDVNKLSYLFK